MEIQADAARGIRIRIKQGDPSNDVLRTLFEESVRSTPVLMTECGSNLECRTVDGGLEYRHGKTHTLFVGFAIGLRAARRFEKAYDSPEEAAARLEAEKH